MTATPDSSGPLDSLANEIELLERHIAILNIVKKSQPVGLIRLSEMTGIPKHKVRYSLKLLEKDGIIKATVDGAVVTDRYEWFMDQVRTQMPELHSMLDRIESNL